MYSSHRIDSVTCLRLSSRCTAAQSGSPTRRWPCRLPLPSFANSWASRAVSVRSSGSGQLSPAAAARRIVSRTVEGATPIRRAISRLGSAAAFILITSRTWRIASLSVGIQGPLRKAERATLWEPEEAASPGRDHAGMVGEIVSEQVGDFKSEWWARSSRNAGRDRAESAAQAFDNIDRLLAPFGIVYHQTAAAFPNHGFWSVSPTAFFDFYESRQFELGTAYYWNGSIDADGLVPRLQCADPFAPKVGSPTPQIACYTFRKRGKHRRPPGFPVQRCYSSLSREIATTNFVLLLG